MTETIETTEAEYRARAAALGTMLTVAPYRHNQATWGTVRPENECGTAACAAGWSLLAGRGIVTIAADGGMTWDPAKLGAEEDRSWYSSDDLYEDAVEREHTLWRDEFGDEAEREGRQWLGLSFDAANTVFLRTLDSIRPNEIARELLLRVGDGRLGEWLDGEIHFSMTGWELSDIAAGLPKTVTT